MNASQVRWRQNLTRMLPALGLALAAVLSVQCGEDDGGPPAGPVDTAVPEIHVDKSALSFSVVEGADPPPQSVVITNVGNGTLTGLVPSIVYDQGQPVGWLYVTLLQATAPTQLDVSAVLRTLPAGTYNASVLVSSVAASNSPASIGVTATVAALPPATGGVQVFPTTTGSDIDPDGYQVELSGTGYLETRAVGSNGQVRFDDVPVGDYTVTILGIAGNCFENSGSETRSVTVFSGTTSNVFFNVRCSPL